MTITSLTLLSLILVPGLSQARENELRGRENEVRGRESEIRGRENELRGRENETEIHQHKRKGRRPAMIVNGRLFRSL